MWSDHRLQISHVDNEGRVAPIQGPSTCTRAKTEKSVFAIYYWDVEMCRFLSRLVRHF